MKNLVMNTMLCVELILNPKKGEVLIDKEDVKVMSIKEFLNSVSKYPN